MSPSRELHTRSIALKMWLLSSVLFFALSRSLPASPAVQQEPQQNAEEPTYEFYSGTVSEVPEGKVTVVRTLLGKAPESRTFIINGETKVEGRLRAKVRVTVGYKTTDEGDVAVRIIVRNSQGQKR